MRNREPLVWVFSSREKALYPFLGRQKQTTLPESFKNYNFFIFLLCVLGLISVREKQQSKQASLLTKSTHQRVRIKLKDQLIFAIIHD